jgi:type VI secretion system secreted protein VgrG
MAITQDTRRLKVRSPLGDDVLIPTSLDVLERISGLFELDCTFVSEREDVNFDDIIGQGVGLELEMAGGEARYFHGVVAAFSQSDAAEANVVYQAKLVPWLWFLTRSADCRIFQNKSVVDIVKEVFDGHKLSDYKLDKLGSYDPIPYCVQYRETDFNFVSRLLEDWGIGYFFSHSADAHELVLFDANASIEECPGQAKASYESDVGDANTAGQVLEWSLQQEFRAGAYRLTDYNYEDPSLDLGVEKATQQAVGGNDRFEIYDYPGDYVALKPGDWRTQLRMEAEECASRLVRGSGTCYGFCPGFKFDLVGHYRADFDATYLITEVRHTFSQVVGKGDETSSYENSFACIPHSVPYRPLLVTPKPVIQGVQTAVVTGADGKEVDIDEDGRVVVQFHWDRQHSRDAESSCRIRVGHAWAGTGWGFFCAPRVGQEVIVEFLEGDPDRPIITGLAYNAEQRPPYEGGTQSGMRTRSTPGGGTSNFNELRFEDKLGAEEVFMQAEKDMKIHVKASDSKTVGGSSSTNAGGAISQGSGASISRTADDNIDDKAGKAMNVATGKDMSLTSGGSYALKTNMGIHLKAINFAADLIESGAKAAAAAIVKGGAKAGIGAAAAGGQSAAQGGDGGAAGGALASGLASTGSQALVALAPAIESGKSALNAQSEAAAASGEQLPDGVNEAIEAGEAFDAAIASGASPDNIAAAALTFAGSIADNFKDVQKIVEGLLPQIPSIALWAMKDVNALALWSMTLEARVKNIDIQAKNKDVNVKAKQNINLETEKKDISTKASKKITIEAGDQITIKTGKAKITMEKNGDITIEGKEINLKGSGNIVMKGKKILRKRESVKEVEREEQLLDSLIESSGSVPKLDGLVIGTLAGWADSGEPLVDFHGNPAGERVPARSLVPLERATAGREVALLFEAGDPQRPVVLGLLRGPEEFESELRGREESPKLPIRVDLDGERLTLTAEREIVLRVGKASITLTRAGKVLIRGAHLLSRSSGVNRIKGGSVQIN